MTAAKIETLEQNSIGRHLYPSLGFIEVARQIHYAMPLLDRAANEPGPNPAEPRSRRAGLEMRHISKSFGGVRACRRVVHSAGGEVHAVAARTARARAR